MNGNVIRTITIRGTSEGLDKLQGDLNKLAQGHKDVAIAQEQTSKSSLSLEQSMARLERRYVEGVRAQQDYAKIQKELNRAVAQNPELQERANAVLAGASQRYNTVTTATKNFATQTGLARHELINLGRQAQDVVVSLGSGQGLGTVLLQQGSQIADVFVSSGKSVGSFFSQAIGWGARFATSAAGVATGIGAIAAGALYVASAWQDGQREIEKALLGIGRQSGATVKNINEIASAGATATGLSVDQARGAALEFVKTGAIFRDNIQAAVDVTHNFAIVTGKDAKAAAQDLAAALADPVRGADALNKQLGFLDGRTREYIATLVSQNRNQEAQAVLLRNLAPAIQQATEALGPFEKAWDAVANAASRAKNAVGAALTPNTDKENLDKLVERRAAIQQNMGFGLFGQSSGNVTEVKRLTEEIESLLEKMREVQRAKALAFEQFKLPSLKADEAVRELLPYIDQLKKVDELLAKLKEAQATPGIKERMGLADDLEKAIRAAEVLKMNLKEAADQQDRANQIGLALAKKYETQSIAVAKTLAGLEDQAKVAGAVGGLARMIAQEQARYNELVREGLSHSDAAKIAAAERAVTQAKINSQALETLWHMKNQLPVIEAVGGAAKLAAQEQATFNRLVFEGVSPLIASQVAAQERANAQAQINTQAKETLILMGFQRGVAEAITGSEKIRAAAQATYNRLLFEGVNKGIALAIAAEQEYQAREQINAQVYEQVHLLEQQTELVYARMRGTEATVKAEQAYENAIRAGADAGAASALQMAVLANERAKNNERAAQAAEREAAAAAEMARRYNEAYQAHKFLPFNLLDQMGALGDSGGLFQSKQGGYSQFNPAGYESLSTGAWKALNIANNIERAVGAENVTKALVSMPVGGYGASAQGMYMQATIKPEYFGKVQYGEGNYRIENGVAVPTEEYLSRGKLTAETLGNMAGPTALDSAMAIINTMDLSDQTTTGALARFIELLPEQERIAPLMAELAKVQQLPYSLARDELLQNLNEQLKQLTDATRDNTSAITDVFSPFYSQDPRSSKLGFRTFAGGGIMTQYGELPLRQYQGGGMATSPQVAVFGEGSTPEAYVPVPSGRIPVEIKMPANSNVRPVVVNINVHGNADANTVAGLRQTGYQAAQAMRRSMASGR